MSNNKNKIICSFCGEDYTDKPNVSILEAPGNPELHICENCLAKGYSLIKQNDICESQDFTNDEDPKENLTPMQIKSFLDQYVIGQEKAKQILSVATYNHMKLLEHYDNCQDKDVELEKSNIVLCGPSGSGRVNIVSYLQKMAVLDRNV